jgi:hypothetical protein
MGRADFTFGGPKNGLPSNGPARNTVFVTPTLAGQTADKYFLPVGNLVELFGTGSASRFFGPGSDTTTTLTGAIQAIVGPFTSLMQVDPFQATLSGPSVQVVATAGSAILAGSATVTVSSAGAIAMNAPAITMTAGAGPIGGGVLTDGCIDAVTGLPFSAAGTFGVPQVRIV